MKWQKTLEQDWLKIKEQYLIMEMYQMNMLVMV